MMMSIGCKDDMDTTLIGPSVCSIGIRRGRSSFFFFQEKDTALLGINRSPKHKKSASVQVDNLH